MNRLNQNTSNILFFRIILSLFLLAWILGFILPCSPIDFFHSIYPISKMLYSTTCHQNELKSFSCNGIPLLVCSRCSGIYFGAFTSSLILLFFQRIDKLNFNHIVTFSSPMLLDVIFYSISIYDYNKIIALSTGFLFGSTIFLYILSNVEYLIFTKQN